MEVIAHLCECKDHNDTIIVRLVILDEWGIRGIETIEFSKN